MLSNGFLSNLELRKWQKLYYSILIIIFLSDFTSRDFIRSLVNYEPTHERFRTFLIFCGVHSQKGLTRARDKTSDMIYEKQLESVDTFRIYLKVSE